MQQLTTADDTVQDVVAAHAALGMKLRVLLLLACVFRRLMMRASSCSAGLPSIAQALRPPQVVSTSRA
jgi:hypothetical protein